VKPIDPRLFRYIKGSKRFIALLSILTIARSALIVMQGYLLARITVQVFQHHKNWKEIHSQLIALLVVFVIRSMISALTPWLAGFLSIRIRFEIERNLLNAGVSGSAKALREIGSPKYLTLLTNGVSALDGYFAQFIPQLIASLFIPPMVFVVIFRLDLRSAIIIIFTVPLMPIFGIVIGRFTGAATEAKWREMSLLTGYFSDLVTGIRTLLVYGRLSKQEKKIDEVNKRYSQETMRVLRISFLSSLTLELITTISVALIAVSLGLRLVNGSVSLNHALIILIICPEVYWPIRQSALYFHSVADGVSALNSFFELLEPVDKNEPQATENAVNSEPVLIDWNHYQLVKVEWKDLAVTFDTGKEIVFPDGEISNRSVFALTSPSGSGKSTLTELILGFREPTRGEIIYSVAERNIVVGNPAGAIMCYRHGEIARNSLLARISWLPQDPHLPVGSVYENFRLVDPSLTSDLLVALLQKVGISSEKLRKGLDTSLRQSKSSVSTGELRRIATARAMAKDADLYILDEPSASVDSVNEKLVGELIRELSQSGRMVLLISHRTDLVSEVMM
jgi:ABC-type transport system involved in cytochrome bd biosynthesis fused ATPase/permease subunit